MKAKAMERLLRLLSSALYGTELDEGQWMGMTAEDWDTLIDLAVRQSILALIAERILSLPKDLRPERIKCIELGMAIQMVEKQNQRLTEVLAEIKAEYEGEGLSFVLLKGHTMACHYPNPLLRSPGDIDLLLYREGDYERANALARRKGYRFQGESLYEQLYWRGRVAVENHRYLAYFGIPRYDKALAEILNPIIEREDWGHIDINGLSYQTLPRALDAVYCFQHILHHFSYLGIGLRQVCDWLLLLERSQDTLDKVLFRRYAEELDLIRPMRLFALMATTYLGARAEIFPFDLPSGKTERDLARLIIQDIAQGGNFGMEHFAGKKFGNVWARRWFMFRKTTARSIRIAPISPEHIRLKPLVAIATRLKLLFGGVKLS